MCIRDSIAAVSIVTETITAENIVTGNAQHSEGKNDMSSTGAARTLAEKVWEDHVVARGEGEGLDRRPDLLYIDLHLVHEV